MTHSLTHILTHWLTDWLSNVSLGMSVHLEFHCILEHISLVSSWREKSLNMLCNTKYTLILNLTEKVIHDNEWLQRIFYIKRIIDYQNWIIIYFNTFASKGAYDITSPINYNWISISKIHVIFLEKSVPYFNFWDKIFLFRF